MANETKNSEKKLFKIGELSKRSGLTIDTLRYYDEIGLLMPAERRKNGYRLYDDISIERLAKINFYKQLGYTLDEIKKLLDRGASAEETYKNMSSIDEEMRRLENKKKLNELHKIYGDSLCDIFTAYGSELSIDKFFEMAAESEEKYKELPAKFDENYYKLRDTMLRRVAEVGAKYRYPDDLYASFEEPYGRLWDIADDFYLALCDLFGDDPDDINSCAFAVVWTLYLEYSGSGEIARDCAAEFGGQTPQWAAEGLFTIIGFMLDEHQNDNT